MTSQCSHISYLHRFCGECTFDNRSPLANIPFSFLRKPAATVPAELPAVLPLSAKGAKRKRAIRADSSMQPFVLRSWRELKAVLEMIRKV